MPAPCYAAWNSATGALTAPPASQLTNATINTVRTMLQVAPASTTSLRIIEWGYILDATPTAPLRVELIDTDAIFASGLTAHVAAGIHKVNVPTGAASTVQLGAALTGYNVAGAGTENTITSTRLLDYKTENGLYYVKQFPLGREPEIAASKCLRIRATPTVGAATSIACYVMWEE